MTTMSEAAQPVDLQALRAWIGTTRVDEDIASVRHARLMAATVDRPGPALQAGDPLPPLWHWLYFLEGVAPAGLGRDGHPARGGFLPPVPLSNRMWAGGRLAFEAPIVLGQPFERRSTVLSIDHKRGRSGDLVFVTVEHQVFSDGRRALREEHDIVYKEPTPKGAAGAVQATTEPEPAGEHQRVVTPDSTMLFRYSALTFNGHRIHYDQDYCRGVEGYDNLVIHGPLSATLLAEYAEQIGGARLARFVYRGLRPAILGVSLTLHARQTSPGELDVWTTLPDGSVSMRATAGFAAGA